MVSFLSSGWSGSSASELLPKISTPMEQYRLNVWSEWVLGAGKPCDCVLWFGHKTPCRFLENQTCLISFTSGVFASGRDLTHSSPEPLLRKHVAFDYRSLFTVFQGNITLGNEKKKNPKHKQTTLRQDCRENDCCHCLMMFIGCFVPQYIVSSLRFEGSFSIGSGA